MLSFGPCALVTCECHWWKGPNKSTMIHEPERGITLADVIPKPFASVIDGVALVCQSNYIGLTYNEFADNILKFVTTITTTTSGASSKDIVFDIY